MEFPTKKQRHPGRRDITQHAAGDTGGHAHHHYNRPGESQ